MLRADYPSITRELPGASGAGAEVENREFVAGRRRATAAPGARPRQRPGLGWPSGLTPSSLLTVSTHRALRRPMKRPSRLLSGRAPVGSGDRLAPIASQAPRGVPAGGAPPRRPAARPMDSADLVGSSPFAPATCFVGVDLTRRRFRFCELRWQATPFGGVASVRAAGSLRSRWRAAARRSPRKRPRPACGPPARWRVPRGGPGGRPPTRSPPPAAGRAGDADGAGGRGAQGAARTGRGWAVVLPPSSGTAWQRPSRIADVTPGSVARG